MPNATETCLDLAERLHPYQFFQDLAPDDFELLKEDIRLRGVQTAIEMTAEGEILDGHQRHRACQELGIIAFPRRIILGLDEDGKIHHAIKANCLRRQLSRRQRRDLIVGELKRNPSQSNRLLAELIGVDKNTIQSVRKELESGGEIHHVGARDGRDGKIYRPSSIYAPTPQEARKAQRLLTRLGDDIPEGRQMSLGGASALLHKKKRARINSIMPPIAPRPGEFKICHQEFQSRGPDILDHSADLVFTRPCPDQVQDSLWEELARFASCVLKPGALLVASVEQANLAQALYSLSQHLKYVTCLVAFENPQPRRLPGQGIVYRWKPLLIFSLGLSEVGPALLEAFEAQKQMGLGREPDPELEAAMQCVRALVKPGSLVIDPCMNAGTIAEAAIRNGMSFQGYESNVNLYQQAKRRLEATIQTSETMTQPKPGPVPV